MATGKVAIFFCHMFVIVVLGAYSTKIAPVGQTDSQAPQSMHAEASITYLSSPGEMQPTGHSPEQAPQLMQVSLIL